MASSPSRHKSTDMDDDVHSESDIMLKAENPIRTYDDLPYIDPSIPYPVTRCLDFVRANFWHETTQVCMSVCTCSVEDTSSVYFLLAKKALVYYNAKEKTNLSFVSLQGATYQPGSDRVHMCIFASLDESPENVKVLFAELLHGCMRNITWALMNDHPQLSTDHFINEYHVQGCCLLEKIDSGNPIGLACDMCGDKIIHPGPRRGYMIAGGDSFKGYPFWDYHSLVTISEPTSDERTMYRACARKAIQYFNSTQCTDFGDLEVGLGSFSNPCEHKTIIHVNFTCSSQLFFAELLVPTFATIDRGIWDTRKEPFIEVKGCCLMERKHGGLPFGRACEMCFGQEVIHPGPKDGYSIVAGDDFSCYGFMDIGTGIY